MNRRCLGIVVATLLASGPPHVGAEAEGQDAGRDAFSAGRYEDAFSLLRPRAEAGEAAAQFLVGLMRRDGLGVPRDISEAQRWLKLAAEQGYDGARFVLGEIELVDGSASAPAGPTRPLGQPAPAAPRASDPVPDSMPEPIEAAAPGPRGEPAGRPSRSPSLPSAPLTGRAHWLEMAAKQGTASAQYDLARLYETGRDAPLDLSKALEWYRKAAEQGHRSAQVQLAYLLASGEGRDLTEAFRWYRAAAEAGDAQAQFSLALLLAPGDGPARLEAVSWLEQAAGGSSGRMRERIVARYEELVATLTPAQIEEIQNRRARREAEKRRR